MEIFRGNRKTSWYLGFDITDYKGYLMDMYIKELMEKGYCRYRNS